MITKELFGNLQGTAVFKYTMKNASGISFSVINYGAAITNLFVPDENGKLTDVVLGFENLEGYVKETSAYIGSICGRFANRIANGKFTLQHRVVEINRNLGKHTLHGGFEGFDKKIWEADILPGNEAIRMYYKSPDGEEGFPGTLHSTVTFSIQQNALHITFEATAEAPTVVGLTHHGYFNLSGNSKSTALQQRLYLNAQRYLETDSELIPTGRLLPVAGTPYDFSTLKTIAAQSADEVLYDHSFVLNKTNHELAHAATLVSDKTGICMQVFTTHPVIHFYDGAHLQAFNNVKQEYASLSIHSGLCLEAQHYYDNPNHPEFPSGLLLPGQTYKHETIFKFSI